MLPDRFKDALEGDMDPGDDYNSVPSDIFTGHLQRDANGARPAGRGRQGSDPS
jgi:hypothetical protein